MNPFRISDFGLWIAVDERGKGILLSLPVVLMGLILLLPSAVFAQSSSRNQSTSPSEPTAPATTMSQPSTQPSMLKHVITFARSGDQIEAKLLPRIRSRYEKDAAALFAFGRRWTTSDVYQTSARCWTKVTVPSVRVPTVFTIASSRNPNWLMGELVAYPDRKVDWDKKLTLYSCGVPSWFNQWSSAVGLPVNPIASADLSTAKLVSAEEDGKSLLILGRDIAGNNLADMLKLTRDKATNAIVLLDAAPARTALRLCPGDFRGPLASLNTRTWARPLSFSHVRISSRILCNRWELAETSPIPSRDGAMSVLPLEVIGFLNAGFWVTVSGIPWQEQLGRREQADELLMEVLKAAATFAPKVETLRQGILLYPEKVVYDPKTMGYCPALACIAQNNNAVGAARVLIVDLRGDDSPPPTFWII